MEGLSKYLADQIDQFDEILTAEELARHTVDREKLMESVEALWGNTTATLLTRINIARSSVLKQKPEICDRAHEVRKKANEIVHGKTCKGPEALRVLKDTREIIVCLYRNSR